MVTLMSRPISVLMLPGLHNSDVDHWQSRWEASYGYQRVIQDEWVSPRCSAWIMKLDETIASLTTPPLLVAHSSACALVGHWWAAHRREISGALLVAPSDTESPSYPARPIGFAPMPLQKLPFPTIVVASTDDPAVRFERARFFAACWGSEFVNAGAAGHIESKSGYGPWPEGHCLLERLLSSECSSR